MDFLSSLGAHNGVRILTVGGPIFLWLAGLLGKGLIVDYNFSVLGADLAYCAIGVCASAAARTIASNANVGMNVLSFYIELGLMTAIIWMFALSLGKNAIVAAKRAQEIESKETLTRDEITHFNRLRQKSAFCSALSVAISTAAFYVDISYAVEHVSPGPP